jgi:hypothetical protein
MANFDTRGYFIISFIISIGYGGHKYVFVLSHSRYLIENPLTYDM